MLLLVVNFHYIQPENKYPFSGIHSVSVERLSSQLDILGQHFDFISQDDLLEAIEGKKKLPERCCLITFDDGLKGQYQNALPVLKKKGVPAIFFINTLPLKEKKACLVHKIHWLRANLPPEDFLEEVDNKLKEISGQSLDQLSFKEGVAERKYLYDEPEIAKLKFILNHTLKTKEKEKVIGGIFKKVVNNERDFCEQFYVSKEEVIKLSELSFLGTHSYAHRSFSQLSGKQMTNEIEKSLITLHQIIGDKRIFSISYPYRDLGDISQLVDICKSLGLKLGFTTERSFNKSLQHPFLFARMDTNDVLGGKFAGFTLKNNEVKILDNKIGLSRHLYF